MKFLVCVLLIAAGANATPLYENRNGDKSDAINSDWILVPDANYNLHLIDTNAEETAAIEPTFNGPNDMVFQLFTRSNPTVPQTIRLGNNQDLQNSFFNPNHQTRFHVHGWLDGGANVPANPYRDAYLQQGDFNFFAVDWTVGGQTPNYILARQRVGECGRGLAAFLDFLNLNGNPFSAFTVLGHSLGAHCAGHAGKQVTRGRIAVIVGLDPAGPLFSIDSNDRLDHTDANHVEMMATDTEFLGFLRPLGHANFYANWGSRQPGCEGEIAGICSHQIVAHFMVNSINPANVFGAIRCRDFNDIVTRNCVVSGPSRRMAGEPVVDGISAPGSIFFLTTNPTAPFAQGPR
ncbi:phospholipase A1 member A-like isoform X2 [Bradysia coprophila]|uniref:phospholipase A1 member A-like isoform X2 n=1 Tax=Bradysia coprophila TaxID=38358 RepID=UPI00187DA257|nr:phospholipase A1 member A-like isoform X2 [Bradysia coprophila]